MKTTILLILVTFLGAKAADTYAQTAKINLQMNGKSIAEVLLALEDQTEFRFFYNDMVNLNQKVDVNFHSRNVFDVLDALIDGTNIRYKVFDRQVALFNENDKSFAFSVQQAPVTGKVTSSDGQPLPGVSVIIKGTTVGTITNIDGIYTLPVPNNGTIVFSFIGMKTKEVPVNNLTRIDVVLESDVMGVEEVIVIGYGTRKKEDVTTSISVVNSSDLSKSNALAPEIAMQGKLAGVFVQGGGSQPFARPTVRVRGTNTWGIADPLYVIDGVPITEYGAGAENAAAVVQDLRSPINIMSMINPSDIESISVLKDASAAAIYGVRAANGVILITTKRGQEGKSTITVNSKYGIQNISRQYEMLNVQQYVQLYQEAYANNPAETQNMPKVFKSGDPAYLGNLPTQLQQDAIVNKNAVMQDHSVKISGGNRFTDYYVSTGFSDTESPYINSWQKRYSLATNLNTKVTSFLRAGVNYRFVYSSVKDEAGGQYSGSLWEMANMPPWQPIFDKNGPGGYAPAVKFTYSSYPTGFTSSKLWGEYTGMNRPGQMYFNDADFQILRNLGTAFVELEPVDGLKFKGTISFDWFYNRRNVWNDIRAEVFNFTPQDPVSYGDPADGNDTVGSYDERHNRNFNMVKEFAVNYSKIFGEHSIDALFNFMDQKYTFENILGSSSQIPSFTRDFIPMSFAKPEYRTAQNFKNHYGLQGYLGRILYSYARKYYFDATVRRDGTSRFHPDNRWGTFPSFSAAWRISSENFMKQLTWLNDLKIRGGWGKLGNQETQAFAYLSMVSRSPDYAFGVNTSNSSFPGALGTLYWGTSLPSYPNSDLTWEATTTTNIGFDAVLLNKIDISFEYYTKTTDGILQASKLPASVGNEQDPVINIAEVRNNGIELSLGYRGKLGPLNFSANANLTTVKNEVLSLYGDAPMGGEQGRIEEGFPIGYLWGFKTGGVFQNQAEVDAYKSKVSDKQAASQVPGDMWFKDVNGPPDETHKFYTPGADNIVNLNDRTYIGKTIPGFFYGLNLNFDYKGFDLGIFMQGVGDVQKVNNVLWGGTSMSSVGNNQLTKVLDRWTTGSPSKTMPRAAAKDPAQNTRFSDRWVENAGYLRIGNVQLGYSLPKNLFGNRNIFSNARIYLSGSNLATFTKWSGLDPESEGVPIPVGFSAGLDITF